MDPLYIFIFGAIGVIIAIGVGLELSKGIEEFVIYLLFWMLYIVTIATFINIILVINYYLKMKDKTGIPGLPGDTGDQGDSGDAGLCDPKCRDSVCENQILEMLNTELKKRENNKNATVRFNNIYIKSKVRQMCASDEFKQVAPNNGPYNLINYLKDIWKIWFDKLYEEGGIKYFENISAETEFEWLNDNPFFELKKYDVFYWGMGKQYRPQLIDKCYTSNDGNTPDTNINGIILRVSPTTLYEKLGDDAGSGAANQVSFFRAKQFTYKGVVYYPVGDLAYGPTRSNDNINIVRHVGEIKIRNDGPNRETIIVSGDVLGPIDYSLIWTNNKFWIWRPIAPINYISLGDVVTFNSSSPPTGDNAPIRCVFKDLTIRAIPNGNALWSSYGSATSTNTLLLGFTPNNSSGSYISSSSSNCYNMFRAVIGLNMNTIPESDINGSFYYLDENKYDINNIIGRENGNPPINNDANKVGKGYIKFPQKDVKYSIMPYLNLKNNAVLKHVMSNIKINAQLIPNAISNAYLINIGNDKYKKCLKFDGKAVTIASCDEEVSSQVFSILFTGNKKNECKLQHYDTKKIIKFKNDLYTLVDINSKTDIEYQLFIMQA